jgi:serine/threonine protein kinase
MDTFSLINYVHTNSESTQKLIELEGKTLQNGIKILKYINKGGFGVVFKVLYKKRYQALKVSLSDQDDFKLEIAFMKNNNYPFMLKINYDYGDHLYMIDYFQPVEKMENAIDFNDFITKKTFANLKSQTKIDIVVMFFLQMSTALFYLHTHGIIFNDFKPDNVMIDEDGFMHLIDYGLMECVYTQENKFKIVEEDICKVKNSRSLSCPLGSSVNMSGTSHYYSPTIVNGGCHSFRDDFWAMASSFYEIMFSTVLVPNLDDEELEYYYRSSPYYFLEASNLSEEDGLYKCIRSIYDLVMTKKSTPIFEFYMLVAQLFTEYIDIEQYSNMLKYIQRVEKKERDIIISFWRSCWKKGNKHFASMNFRKCNFSRKQTLRAHIK